MEFIIKQLYFLITPLFCSRICMMFEYYFLYANLNDRWFCLVIIVFGFYGLKSKNKAY
jgi:hypothetical protein